MVPTEYRSSAFRSEVHFDELLQRFGLLRVGVHSPELMERIEQSFLEALRSEEQRSFVDWQDRLIARSPLVGNEQLRLLDQVYHEMIDNPPCKTVPPQGLMPLDLLDCVIAGVRAGDVNGCACLSSIEKERVIDDVVERFASGGSDCSLEQLLERATSAASLISSRKSS